jgi:hypothetical protein
MSSIRATSALAFVAVALATPTAFGDPAPSAPSSAPPATPATTEETTADSLFTEAKQLMATGNYTDACPKLAESYRLDPGTGTLTALALCHEQIGKTATAYNEFTEVATSSQQQGRADRLAFAQQHITSLEPGLSRLTIEVPPEIATISKLQIKRDGVIVSDAGWGIAAPVDPGDHLVEATAPDRVAWSTHVTVDANGDKKEVNVPPLALAPVLPTPEVHGSGDSSHRGAAIRMAGLITGSAGVVALGIGAYFGASAISESNDAKKQCRSSPCGSSSAVNENDSAKTSALVSDVTVVIGLAAIGAGAFLYLTAPKDAPASNESPQPAAAWRIVPSIGNGGGQVSLYGSF